MPHPPTLPDLQVVIQSVIRRTPVEPSRWEQELLPRYWLLAAALFASLVVACECRLVGCWTWHQLRPTALSLLHTRKHVFACYVRVGACHWDALRRRRGSAAPPFCPCFPGVLLATVHTAWLHKRVVLAVYVAVILCMNSATVAYASQRPGESAAMEWDARGGGGGAGSYDSSGASVLTPVHSPPPPPPPPHLCQSYARFGCCPVQSSCTVACGPGCA